LKRKSTLKDSRDSDNGWRLVFIPFSALVLHLVLEQD